MTNSKRQFVKLTIEVAIDLPLPNEIGEDISDTINGLPDKVRAVGAGRTTEAVISSQAEYDEWYKGPSVTELQIPVPTVVRWD